MNVPGTNGDSRGTGRQQATKAGGLAPLIGAAVIGGAGVVLLFSPFGPSFARFSYDLAFVLHPLAQPTEAVVVIMDDASHRRLQQPVQGPWDRSRHIQLIRELTSQGAKAVVFDILFDQPWTNPVVDAELAAAIRAHGRVVLAARCASLKGEVSTGSELLRAAEPIGSSASWGVAELPIDPDSATRRHPEDVHYPSLAWQAAVLLDRAPKNRLLPRWINYYGLEQSIPRVSYFKLFETDSLPANYFSNKVVFVGAGPVIGYSGSTHLDTFWTPYSRWTGMSMTGVEVHATVFLNLVRRDWLTQLHPATEIGIVLLSGLAAFLGLSRLRPLVALGIGAMLIIGLPLLFICLTWLTHLWLSWAIIAFFQVPVATGWVILRVPRPPERAEPPAPKPLSENVPSVPDHTLIRLIGKGAYGEVWLARNAVGQYRAAKIVHRNAFADQGPFDREFAGMTRFERVSREHEGFVDILQVGKSPTGGYFYYVMEIGDDRLLGQQINPDDYSSKTLAEHLKTRGRLPMDECLRIGLLLTDALQFLHDQKLVHRDIKPSNIVYINGRPKLADIGLVAKPDEAKSFVGTPGFMAPEGPGTIQADIYSLGMVLYECFSGLECRRFPELPASLFETRDQDRLRELNSIILKACNNRPRQRYRSARRMHEGLMGLSEKRLPAEGRQKRQPPG